jgi:hypothetical protein
MTLEKNDVELYGRTGRIPFGVTFANGNQYTPAHLYITLFMELPFSMSVTKENLDCRIAKKLGLIQDMKTGIPEFDEKVCITSNNPEKCRQYLSEGERWKTILRLYEKGWLPYFDRKKICFVKRIRAQGSDRMWVDLINEDELTDTLQQLSLMAT